MPFYLQPTLGGTDINNVDVLRSYRDYRFRAPNVVAFQAEYRRTIWGTDRGPGLLRRGPCGRAALRYRYCPHAPQLWGRMIVQVGSLPVFKVYYAWGGSEGTHTTYTANTNNFAFSAPGGVF